MPIAGGNRTMVPGVQWDEGGPFVVTLDKILYDFTATGFRSISL